MIIILKNKVTKVEISIYLLENLITFNVTYKIINGMQLRPVTVKKLYYLS